MKTTNQRQAELRRCRIVAGLCPRCGKVESPGTCRACVDQISEYRRKRKAKTS